MNIILNNKKFILVILLILVLFILTILGHIDGSEMLKSILPLIGLA